MAFLGSWLMNILFYKVHPSAVDCSKKGVREKLFIHVQGKKRFLWGYRDSKAKCENETAKKKSKSILTDSRIVKVQEKYKDSHPILIILGE